MLTLPFNSVDELTGSLGDLALNQTRATASVRLSGGVATHNNGINSRVYHHASRGRQYGGIMSVEEDYFEDKRKEFGRVHAIIRERGGFGRNNKDPPFYVLFKFPEKRDAARASYGPRCLNCGDENHFARVCPEKNSNRS